MMSHLQLTKLGAADAPELWSSHCAPYPGKRIVFVSVSSQFMDMFRNWLVHASPHLDPDTDQLVAYAENPEALPLLQRMSGLYGVRFDARVDRSWHQIGGADSNCRHGSASCASVVTHTPKVISDWLEANCAVLYHDIDTAWRSSVMSVLDSVGVHDVVATDDARHPNPSNLTNLCGCFLYVQPSAAGKAFARRWYDASKGKMFNQPAMNEVLSELHAELGVYVLPSPMFPNGWNAEANIKTAVAVHANYLKGTDSKIELLRKLSLWSERDAA
mmetsp:Transcript_55407/g.153406  ORF Transcript_55407/g.153406 Transcript_55407/m.153406 type:complete len:273 (-) Transcript_55407:52-870(-)